jgi:hypothetical protein
VKIGDLKLGNVWHSQSEIFKLLVNHVNRYPQMGVQDAYKLLYQGTMGPEHLASMVDEFEKDLQEEMDSVAADDSIPVWENIRPDGQLVRVYLAPFKARGGQSPVLATLSFWSRNLFNGSTEDLKTGWETFMKLCHDKHWNKFPQVEIGEFDRWLREYQFPPVHHTEVYRETYHPFYRLLQRDFLNVLPLGKQG